jgi:hypothetical protein
VHVVHDLSHDVLQVLVYLLVGAGRPALTWD